MTTLGCHLCDQAWAMVEYLMATEQPLANCIDLIKVEISEDDALLEEYGIRIPVFVADEGELGWPFEFEELTEWLAG